VLARNLPLGCHLYGLTPCSLGRIYKAVNPNLLAIYCSKEIGLFASTLKKFTHPANPHVSKLLSARAVGAGYLQQRLIQCVYRAKAQPKTQQVLSQQRRVWAQGCNS
jgi:hypothetical protein